ncbi:glycosyltransferase family 32 protein [Mycena pura]|uniref:Glycosyltransferase family 32 protein n=1 Tax=Mycena pura TaxID=153505 RepID=A0AAD6YPG4_9AGAR|nr:glycosyltransferase family 32 protein [Mycena pura]
MSFTKRRSGSFKGRGLPHYSHAIREKHHSRVPPWFIPIAVPGFRTRRLRFWLPNPRRIHQFSVSRFGRKRGLAFMLLALTAMVFAAFALTKRFGTEQKTWPAFTGDPPTLVFRRRDLQRIWEWEIASGHYPSRRRIPEQLWLNLLDNPALPPRRASLPSRFRLPSGPGTTTTSGVGARRIYLDIQSKPPNVAYPPRPVPGSIADLDMVMEHCDFSEKKYVRDCLEVLRFGGGLDHGRRLRRGKLDDWKYIYLEQPDSENETTRTTIDDSVGAMITDAARDITDTDGGLTKKKGVDWESALQLSGVRRYRLYSSLPSPCDPEHPRIFHMFWTGPFTDKPYLALLSFLFTQNTGLHLHEEGETTTCRPKFWLWINPGPAAAVPNPSALHDMFAQLKSNPWAAPFLHPRFKDVIQFKLWNTTEQLDGVPEIASEWRARESLFNSGGYVINVPPKKLDDAASSSTDGAANGTAAEGSKADDDDMLSRTGSKSSTSYDRLSVILSDMARFILCHRFGGIYLDADTLLLRDWEELWGWKGAFAYRWSRLEKYNTAVLHLNKDSALGTFLFRTALKNDLDFHPMTVSRYLKEAHLEGLLLRLPDALFDSAWLGTEYYQRDRPPQPFFTDFADFFDTPLGMSAAPHALGFDGFFKGAYSYHFHNYWWKPFDSARNWPDLGAQFLNNERIARANLKTAAGAVAASEGKAGAEPEANEDQVDEDQRDLDWSTVLKRTFEAYIRGERPSMYGEWLAW